MCLTDKSQKPAVVVSKKLVLVNSASSLLSKVLNVLILIWLYQYLLQRIAPEEYSLLPVVMSVMIFFNIFNFLFTIGMQRYVIEAYAEGNREKVIKVVSSMVPFASGLGLILLIAAAIFSWKINAILNIPSGRTNEAQLMFMLLMLGNAYYLVTMCFRLGFQVKQKYVWLNVLNLGQELFKITILFILLFGIGPRIIYVIIAQVSAQLLFLSIQIIMSKKWVPELIFRLSSFDFAIGKRIITFGIWSFLSRAAISLRLYMDPIILNIFATPMDVTCFHLGGIFYRNSEHLEFLILAPLMPVLIAMHAKKETIRLLNTFHRGNKYMMWALLLLAAPVIVFREEFILLYVGEKFMLAADVMGLLFLPAPLVAGNVMIWRVTTAVERIRAITIASILIQVANLIVTIILVKYLKMGAIGSAMSTACVTTAAYIFILLPLTFNLLETSLGDWLKRSFIPGIMPAIFGGLVWFGYGEMAEPKTWGELGFGVFIGSIVYGGVILIFGLNKNERKDIRTVLGNFREKVGLAG